MPRYALPANVRALIAAHVQLVDTDERRAIYRDGRFFRSHDVKDLDRRYRWDIWWLARHIHSELPPDTTNAHIDSVLRSLIPSIDGPTYLDEVAA